MPFVPGTAELRAVENATQRVLATAAVYIQAFETITNRAFALPADDGPVLDRIRRNLAPLLAF